MAESNYKMIKERIADLKKEFESVGDWEARYKKIISYGKGLPDLSQQLKTEEAKVRGCQSQVWLHARLTEEGRVLLVGDSDALLVKGLVAILLKVYSLAKPEEILATGPEFLRDLGFEGNLSPSRTNGLFSMVKQIRLFAQAFILLSQQRKQNN